MEGASSCGAWQVDVGNSVAIAQLLIPYAICNVLHHAGNVGIPIVVPTGQLVDAPLKMLGRHLVVCALVPVLEIQMS